MPFRHGSGAVVLWDEYDLSPFLNAASISASMDPGEVTNFASEGNREYIKGLKDATLALEGFYTVGTTEPSTELTDVLNSAFAGTTSPVVTVGLEGDTVGRRAWLFKGDAVSYDIDAPADDVIATSVDLQGRAGYESGVWLKGSSASTSAPQAFDLNSGLANGGTTGGGVAHLHVTTMTATTATTLLQHSTSGSTWATLLSFSAVSGESVQRSTVSGTIKERVRFLLSTLGSTGSITAACAFARYGPFKG